MLKRFFITMLGSIAGIWISFGLLFAITITVFASLLSGLNNDVSIERNSILHLNLAGNISERPTEVSIRDQVVGFAEATTPLNEIVASIRSAANDRRIEGIFIEANGALAGTSSRLDILQALKYFKKEAPEKWIIAYGDSYTQGDYFLASCADSIYLNPVGAIDIHGLAMTTQFYKGLLDKVGVEMQIFKVGTFKSAVEPFTATTISEANREQQTLFLNQIWEVVTEEIAANRGLKAEQINMFADSLIAGFDTQSYIAEGLITNVAYRHEVISKLKRLTGFKGDAKPSLVSPEDYCAGSTLPHSKLTGNNIAILYADGEISDSGKEGIVGYRMVHYIQTLIDDTDNSGLVLRVNSPGGSAFASEQIWEALERYKETGRPLYVSMSDYAASGGYYISCGADKIFAQPTTLTGSIGIFGMIPCIGNLLEDKLGITESTVETNPNATFINITKPLNADQRAAMQKRIERGYELFTSRCAEGRKMPLDSLKTIAEGRVWDGKTALSIGLVDELGNLNDAVEAMAEYLGLQNKYTINEYPVLKLTLLEQIESLQNENLSTGLLKKELGSQYEIYRKVDRIKKMSNIQALSTEVIDRW